MLSDNIARLSDGTLTFAGQSTAQLAEKYGTPLYLMDEERIRRNCRMYKTALRAALGDNARMLYASKAASFRDIYRIMAEEGVGIDVVSAGELYTALSAGFPAENIYFHGNCKTDADLRFGVEQNVGCIVVDNLDELFALEKEAMRQGKKQRIFLRLTPGIDPHTYAAINTGKVDSKFGAAIETGQAEELLAAALGCPHVSLEGVHCHVGSQVFDEDVYERTVDIMIPFMVSVREKYGVTLPALDLGGGYGVRYLESDKLVDIPRRIAALCAHLKAVCEANAFPLPCFLLEPGRSIVADAGMTLYTVGSVKRIPGYKNYVAVDGGMSDNPRHALYGARYTVLHGMKDGGEEHFSLVGCCCESGDVIEPDTVLPSDMHRGDLLAVCTTGAYNYSMASNYNRRPRPPVVMVGPEGSRISVARESWDDLLRLDS